MRPSNNRKYHIPSNTYLRLQYVCMKVPMKIQTRSFLEPPLEYNHDQVYNQHTINTPRLLNRGGIADLLLLRILLAICQKSRDIGNDY